MSSDPLDAVRRELERALARDPHASPAALQSMLDRAMRGYNSRPQAELGGLAPDEVHRLLSADWESPHSAIQVDATVPISELTDALILHDARSLLEIVAQDGPLKTTPKGNLPRATVARFRDRALGYAAEREKDFPPQYVRNEEDHRPLHVARVLLGIARLVTRRKGVFVRTKAGDRLAEPAVAGELYALLLRVHFRAFNLAYRDIGEPFPALQDTIGVAMAQVSRLEPRWYEVGELLDRLLLPSVRASAPRHEHFDLPASLLTTRLLTPLVEFGLMEKRDEGERLHVRRSFRRTSLWDRVVSVHLA